jgi:DNA-binding response OmpR family regulator
VRFVVSTIRQAPEAETNAKDVVLVVEDDVQARTLVAEYLRDVGFTVIEAVDGSEAVAVLNSRAAIDIVFTDVMLPGAIDGRMLASWVDEHCSGTPVLMTSGAADFPFEMRDTRFITKPYIYAAVERRLRELLRLRRRSQLH